MVEFHVACARQAAYRCLGIRATNPQYSGVCCRESFWKKPGCLAFMSATPRRLFSKYHIDLTPTFACPEDLRENLAIVDAGTWNITYLLP
jgi:hypothetical protein